MKTKKQKTTRPVETKSPPPPIEGHVKLTSPIGKCVGRGSLRYALGGVQLIQSDDPNTVYCVETDSRCVAISTASGTVSSPCLVPSELTNVSIPDSHVIDIRVNGKTVTARRIEKGVPRESAIVMDSPEGRFPNVGGVLPDDFVHVVALNADILKKMADVISDNGTVALLFQRNADAAIGVQGNTGIGVVMPLAISSISTAKTKKEEGIAREVIFDNFRAAAGNFRKAMKKTSQEQAQ